ncbi:hypothetical protein ACFV0O_30460 [Kitasatospora sp. NPDC059577]|uniref:acyl-CoA-like ligand-binding transcription factor n=1 Tax=Kitasatospora sp. NPDC059577 TaxID=3346873 RepID=UPI0036CBD6E9
MTTDQPGRRSTARTAGRGTARGALTRPLLDSFHGAAEQPTPQWTAAVRLLLREPVLQAELTRGGAETEAGLAAAVAARTGTDAARVHYPKLVAAAALAALKAANDRFVKADPPVPYRCPTRRHTEPVLPAGESRRAATSSSPASARTGGCRPANGHWPGSAGGAGATARTLRGAEGRRPGRRGDPAARPPGPGRTARRTGCATARAPAGALLPCPDGYVARAPDPGGRTRALRTWCGDART